jgi:hypothetical protein
MSPQPSTNFSAFLQDAQQLLNKCLQLLASKNHDYSETQDAFANFKLAAHIAGIPTEQTLLTLLGMKLARLNQLLGKSKQPKHEAIEDTLMDVINYTLLLRGILQERNLQSDTRPDGNMPQPNRVPPPETRPSSPSPSQTLASGPEGTV